MTSIAGIHEKGTVSLSDVLSRAKKNSQFQKVGAIAVFIGVARGETPKGEKVQQLTLEAYEEKADDILNGICQDLSKKPGIINVQIHHLLGDFIVGDDMVYVSVAGSHRQDVFPVLREAVERYKNEAPIFKKERIVDSEGSVTEYWVSEKESC